MEKKVACISVDMEPDLRCSAGRIRLLEDDKKLNAFCDVMREERVPLTCFTVMKSAPNYLSELNALAQRIRIEFAVHSFSHDQKNPASASEVRLSWEMYCELWNKEPMGYRSPNCLIDSSGLKNLCQQGFKYDSSVVPTVRFDRYGYNNLHLPQQPFSIESSERALVELPVACVRPMRVPVVLSYIKLVGLSAFELAIKAFGLPQIVVVYFHPYDLYAAEIAHNIPGWKRYAHLRNGRNGLALLLRVIRLLKAQGYQFRLMGDLAAELRASSALSTVPIWAIGGKTRSDASP